MHPLPCSCGCERCGFKVQGSFSGGGRLDIHLRAYWRFLVPPCCVSACVGACVGDFVLRWRAESSLGLFACVGLGLRGILRPGDFVWPRGLRLFLVVACRLCEGVGI